MRSGVRRRTWMWIACLVAPGALAAQVDTGEHDATYADIEYLIGRWVISPGGTPVQALYFEWGPNQTFVRYRGTRLVDGQELPAFEGMMIHNPVQSVMRIVTAYTSNVSRFLEEGRIVAVGPGEIRRDFTIYYGPDIGLPWSEGRRSPPGGTVLHFRQTFRAEGPEVLRDVFLMRFDDGWRSPIDGMPDGGWRWERDMTWSPEG